MQIEKLFRMKTLMVALVILSIPTQIFAQGEYFTFCNQSIKLVNTGMIVLGLWAISNILLGAYGWLRFNGKSLYFHQMNFFWNTVNLLIAGIALYNNYHFDCTLMNPGEILSKHLETEKILLINTFLDAGYIGTGFLLRHFSVKSTNRGHLLQGYGNALLLQGGFLLTFDLFLYGTLRSLRMDYLDTIGLTILQ